MSNQEIENQLGAAEPTDTVAGVLAEDVAGVDAEGNTVELKEGEEVIVSKSDILDTADDKPAEAATVEGGEPA